MSALLGLIKGNGIHVFGVFMYGLIGIFLTVMGAKLLQLFGPFPVSKEAGAQPGLALGIATSGLAIALGIIIAVTAYEPAPQTVLLTGAQISQVQPGSGGGCGDGKPCGSAPSTAGGSSEPGLQGGDIIRVN